MQDSYSYDTTTHAGVEVSDKLLEVSLTGGSGPHKTTLHVREDHILIPLGIQFLEHKGII